MKRLIPLLFALTPSLAHADSLVGRVSLIEVWQLGNVAFTINPSPPQGANFCTNGQFILNKSSPGMKNQLATILLAKSTGQTVRVDYFGCGPAENYGSTYIIPSYISLVE